MPTPGSSTSFLPMALVLALSPADNLPLDRAIQLRRVHTVSALQQLRRNDVADTTNLPNMCDIIRGIVLWLEQPNNKTYTYRAAVLCDAACTPQQPWAAAAWQMLYMDAPVNAELEHGIHENRIVNGVVVIMVRLPALDSHAQSCNRTARGNRHCLLATYRQ